jgi:hypothetical protein
MKKALIVLNVSFSLIPFSVSGDERKWWQYGTPADCNSTRNEIEFIERRGCNTKIEGEDMWFPSLRSYSVYTEDLGRLRKNGND